MIPIQIALCGSRRACVRASAKRNTPDDNQQVEEDERDYCSARQSRYHCSPLPSRNYRKARQNSLLINVRTELIKLIIFAFTLAPSCGPPPPMPAPKAGSVCEELPHPTAHVDLLARGLALIACVGSMLFGNAGCGCG